MFMYLIGFFISCWTLAALLGFVKRLHDRLIIKKGTVIAEYDAPHLLSPAELGYLFDRDFGEHEMLATIVSLVQKGFVSIRKHEHRNPLLVAESGLKDNQIKKMDHAEMSVYSWVRQQNHGTISWNSLTNNFSATLGAREAFQHEVRGQLEDKGFLRAPTHLSISDNISELKIAAGLMAILFFILVFLISQLQGTNGDFSELDTNISYLSAGLAVLLLWLPTVYFLKLLKATYYFAANMPVAATWQFNEKWRDVAGYRLFVKTVEFSRLSADTNPYDTSMPYAIALGFDPDLNKLVDYGRRS